MEHWIGGGCIATAGIQLPDLRALNNGRDVIEQRKVCSVTADNQQDAIGFLELMVRIPVRVPTTQLPMGHSNEMPDDLAGDRVGSAVVLLYGVMILGLCA